MRLWAQDPQFGEEVEEAPRRLSRACCMSHRIAVTQTRAIHIRSHGGSDHELRCLLERVACGPLRVSADIMMPNELLLDASYHNIIIS